ncbi:MAG: selenocysteine-specific translation elongation factor [Lachnospiraceae bacterium]|jgi:selenocysteine-specific elongation factor|nr:selenocysteine-specific translation elongation factor [Lachnospiraceae bacterium]
MKHIIIGTAGHIDHGKTTLIKALTGRNTDRFEEEQRRGITIDLGFTWFDLPSGDRAGIIDVPGHERFIANMTAGVVGMDLVLLVIAADEGIMPQTREHMDILGLLGIEKSIVVLNKCDLVDEEWLELMEEDIREGLRGTFLEEAPIVRVSAATKEGLPRLIEIIDETAKSDVKEKDTKTIPRLPVDRVFSLSGFGTVVTGTLISGTISSDDTLQAYPGGQMCKIRSIQVHSSDVKEAFAGQRVAINLSNIKKSELSRGAVLAPPHSMKNTDLLDVKLKVLPTSVRVIEHNIRLHLFTGTSEILCRAMILDKDVIGPGEEGFAQLRLEEETAVKKGDRFIVRFYSPMETIGGGVILEPNPKFKKRFREDIIAELQNKESGSLSDIVLLHVRNYAKTMVSIAELAKLTAFTVDEVSAAVSELENEGRVLVFDLKKDSFVWAITDYEVAKKSITDTMTDYEKCYPYRYGMKKAEIQTRLFSGMKPVLSDLVLEKMSSPKSDNKVLEKEDEYIHTVGYTILRDERFLKAKNLILEKTGEAGYDFIRFSEIEFPKEVLPIAEDVLAVLIKEGIIIRVADDMITLSTLMDAAKDKISTHLEKESLITIAQVRDMFNTSRKSAKPILEYMDGIKITKKLGAESERVAFK